LVTNDNDLSLFFSPVQKGHKMTTLIKTRRKTADRGLEFRTWLRYILKRARRTYEDLARRSGVPLATVKAIARGRRKEPTADTRSKLERALFEIDADYFRLVKASYARMAEDGETCDWAQDEFDAVTIRQLIDDYVGGTRSWAERNGQSWPGPILKHVFWNHDVKRLKASGISPDKYKQFFLKAFEQSGLAEEKDRHQPDPWSR
jgi:transcriptional regulator with XRE-family HTH domain